MGMGAKIKELRVSKGLSQEELAQAAHMSNTYLSMIESEQRKPGDSIVERLAQVLGVSTTILYEAAGVIEIGEVDEEQIRQAIKTRSIHEILQLKYDLPESGYVAEIVEMAVEREKALLASKGTPRGRRGNKGGGVDSSVEGLTSDSGDK